MPVMRPLFFHYPEDDEVVDMDHQFLCGEELLIHPVTASSVKEVEVYLPHGTWYDVDDLTRHEGAGYKKIPVTLSKIPVFQRGGSVIPRKRRVRSSSVRARLVFISFFSCCVTQITSINHSNTNTLRTQVRRSSQQMFKDPITLTVALDSNGEARGDLYQDDEHTFNYKTQDAFQRVQYEFSGLHLKSRVVDGNANTFKPENKIERIEILGLGFAPSRVYSGSSEFEFKYDAEKDLLVVRKPGVVAASRFDVIFKK